MIVCFPLSAQQPGKQGQVFAEVAGEEKILPDKFPGRLPHCLHLLPVMKEEPDPVSRPFGRVDEGSPV